MMITVARRPSAFNPYTVEIKVETIEDENKLRALVCFTDFFSPDQTLQERVRAVALAFRDLFLANEIL